MKEKKDVVRYRCINFGACAKADGNEIIEFPSIDVLGGTPPCPCCKQNTLEEIIEHKSKWPMYVAAGVATVAILGGIGYGVSNMTKSPSTNDTAVKTDTVNQLKTMDEIKDTLSASVLPSKDEKSRESVHGPSTSSGEMKANGTTVKTSPESKGVANKTARTTKKQSLGYGTFSGQLKNGQPNGTGTLRYTSSHLIDNRDPKERVAMPGDYVIGEWKDGKLIQGRWYGSDNNSKGAIIIGM